MTDDPEEALYQAFRSEPGTESLLALLRVHQDHVFNICYQVLHHLQDAQDASQEVLLEVTQGIRQIEDARAFKTWLDRVALHTALNHKKARNRHAELLRRKAAMETPETKTPLEEERSAVIDALAHLDDESRCLVIEHYFDKATLEELGKRHGVSAAAIWKRIERAKEQIKRVLAGAGFAVAPDQVTRTLESVTPVPAPSGLVGEVIISKAALFAAGGVAVGTKTGLSVATLVTFLLCLSAGMVALLVWSATGDLRTIPKAEKIRAPKEPKVSKASPSAAESPAVIPPELPTPTLEWFKLPPGVRMMIGTRLFASGKEHLTYGQIKDYVWGKSDARGLTEAECEKILRGIDAVAALDQAILEGLGFKLKSDFTRKGKAQAPTDLSETARALIALMADDSHALRDQVASDLRNRETDLDGCERAVRVRAALLLGELPNAEEYSGILQGYLGHSDPELAAAAALALTKAAGGIPPLQVRYSANEEMLLHFLSAFRWEGHDSVEIPELRSGFGIEAPSIDSPDLTEMFMETARGSTSSDKGLFT